METRESGHSAVYRLYDSAGTLLYVGVAVDPVARWRSHAAVKQWWPEVRRKTVEWHATRAEALYAEAEAIRTEGPRYNVIRRPYMYKDRPVHKGPVVRLSTQAARATLRDRIDAALESGQHTVVSRHGRDLVVVVPIDWYIEHGGDTTQVVKEPA